MVGERLHIPVATGCGTVEVDAADRLGDVVQEDQCLFGTGKFVHGPSCQGAYGGQSVYRWGPDE
jgi:hypothetical protein